MAIREVAAQFEHVCDSCKVVETSATRSRPKYWSDFHILRDAYDFQGAAVADGSVKLLLCLACSDAAAKAVNAAIDERRALHPTTQGEQSHEG